MAIANSTTVGQLVSDRNLSSLMLRRVRLAFYLKYNRWKPKPDFTGLDMPEPENSQWFWFRRVEKGHVNISPIRPVMPERLEQDREFVSRYLFLEELLNKDRQLKNASDDDLLLMRLRGALIPMVFEQGQWVVVPTYHSIVTYDSWLIGRGKVLGL